MGIWQPTADRFWAKVDKQGYDSQGNKSGCWLWRGATNGAGTPTFNIDGRGTTAARAAATLSGLAYGRWHQITHTCGNKLCVRPDHLEALSKRELGHRRNAAANMAQLKKGRVKVCYLVAGKVTKSGYPARCVQWVSAAQADALKARRAPKKWVCKTCQKPCKPNTKSCSKACWRVQFAARYKLAQTQPCKLCGKPCPRGPCGGGLRILCSEACIEIDRTNRVKTLMPPRSMHLRVCYMCGKNYVRAHYSETLTCGKVCGQKLSWANKRRTCWVCHKPLDPTFMDKRHWCAGACYLEMRRRRKKKKVAL